MVHSTYAQGHVMGRESGGPLGIPKSPSFHSGLDLVASASVDSLKAATADLQAAKGHNAMAARVEPPSGRRRNGDAVRTMQSVGQLPQLKGDAGFCTTLNAISV